MIFGHLISQMVAVAAELALADRLAESPKTAAELAGEVGANPGSFGRFISACRHLGLFVAREGGKYEVTELGRWLGSERPTLRDLAIALAAPGHWRSIQGLKHSVLTGQPSTGPSLGTDIWDYYERNPQERSVFASAMGNISAEVSEELVSQYDLSWAGVIVDVGGSHGVMLSRLLQAAPGAKGILFDLPAVIDEARRRLLGSQLEQRISPVAGDFFEEVPPGGDLYLLKTIIHDWDDEKAKRILANCRKAAGSGSRLLLVERVTDVEPDPTDTLADMLMMVVLGGKERSRAEFEDLLGRAGWRLNRVIPLTMHKLLEAQPA